VAEMGTNSDVGTGLANSDGSGERTAVGEDGADNAAVTDVGDDEELARDTALDDTTRAVRGTCTPRGLGLVGGAGFPKEARWGIGALELVS
jgi:hypothetical protein